MRACSKTDFSQRSRNAAPSSSANSRERDPPMSCQAMLQLMSRMPSSSALTQFGPRPGGHCSIQESICVANRERIARIAGERAGLRQRHQVQVTVRLPQVLDVAHHALVAIVDGAGAARARPRDASADRDSTAVDRRARSRRDRRKCSGPPACGRRRRSAHPATATRTAAESADRVAKASRGGSVRCVNGAETVRTRARQAVGDFGAGHASQALEIPTGLLHRAKRVNSGSTPWRAQCVVHRRAMHDQRSLAARRALQARWQSRP